MTMLFKQRLRQTLKIGLTAQQCSRMFIISEYQNILENFDSVMQSTKTVFVTTTTFIAPVVSKSCLYCVRVDIIMKLFNTNETSQTLATIYIIYLLC